MVFSIGTFDLDQIADALILQIQIFYLISFLLPPPFSTFLLWLFWQFYNLPIQPITSKQETVCVRTNVAIPIYKEKVALLMLCSWDPGKV